MAVEDIVRRGRAGSSPFKGINSITKKLADGRRVTYWYAWKGGPRLAGEYGSGEFVAAFVEATKGRTKKKQPDRRVLLSLLQAYQASGEFRRLAERTKTDYIKQIKKIEAEFVDFPISAMADKRTRGIFKSWRDKLAEASLRQADYAYTVLARVLSWSLDRGLIDANPCEKGGRLYSGERTDALWTDEDEAKFLTHAPKHIHLPFMFGLWTGQRMGDILNLRWSQYDGKYLRLRQGKTKANLAIPVGEPLRRMLDALNEERKPQPFDHICLTERGSRAWTLNGFSTVFRRTNIKWGINGLTFHDTRGTAVTRLAMSGCSVPEIATFTGHSLKDVEAILDSHYMSRNIVMAENALRKLETRTQSPN